jgi:hypothetical protein
MYIVDFHSIDGNTPKQIRDEYNLRQSILNFQLAYVDQDNVACPTNCVCQTEILREIEGKVSDRLISIIYILLFVAGEQ